MILPTKVEALIDDIKIGKEDLFKVLEYYMNLEINIEVDSEKKCDECGYPNDQVDLINRIEDLENTIDTLKQEIKNLERQVEEKDDLLSKYTMLICSYQDEMEELKK